MEQGGAEGEGEKRHLEVGLVAPEVKKQWKNPSQVQILENAYAVARNPSAVVKEELAKLTGLDYKQVQYWFGNRRYMDRHGPRRYRSRNEDDLRYINMAFVSSPSFSTSPMPIADSVCGTESSPYRNFEMLQPFLSTGPVVMQAEITTQMPEELQGVLMHIERKLGHSLRTDGPILGVEFKPLPPGAFGALLAQQKASLCPCNGKVTKRLTNKADKSPTSLLVAECSVTNLADEPTLQAQNVDAFNTDGSTKAVQEFQFFPTQPSWLDGSERLKQAHFPLSSVYTSNDVPISSSSGGQNFIECACAPSSFPCHGQKNAINQAPEEKQMPSPPSLNGNEKAPNLLHTTAALDSQSSNHKGSEMINQLISSDKTITYNNDMCRRGKIKLPGCASASEIQQHDYIEIQMIDDANKERYSGCPENDHGISGQDHGQGGQDTSQHQRGSEIIKEVDDNNSNNATMKYTHSNQLHQIGHWHGYHRFIVRPRERSLSNIMIEGDTRLSYFSNTGDCSRTLIAEWNEIEKKAVFIENENENTLSWSTGSDSTCSDDFVDQATENGKHDGQSKSVDQFGVDNRVDVHGDHNGQEVINVDQKMDDDDETDDEHNDLEDESKNKYINLNENKRASPLSSEQTV